MLIKFSTKQELFTITENLNSLLVLFVLVRFVVFVLSSSVGLPVSVPLVTLVVILFKRHEHHLIWKSCWTPVYVYINANNANEIWPHCITNGTLRKYHTGHHNTELKTRKHEILTQPGLEPTIYHTRGEYANHYASDAFFPSQKKY
jgi:hypothetical protein